MDEHWLNNTEGLGYKAWSLSVCNFRRTSGYGLDALSTRQLSASTRFPDHITSLCILKLAAVSLFLQGLWGSEHRHPHLRPRWWPIRVTCRLIPWCLNKQVPPTSYDCTPVLPPPAPPFLIHEVYWSNQQVTTKTFLLLSEIWYILHVSANFAIFWYYTLRTKYMGGNYQNKEQKN